MKVYHFNVSITIWTKGDTENGYVSCTVTTYLIWIFKYRLEHHLNIWISVLIFVVIPNFYTSLATHSRGTESTTSHNYVKQTLYLLAIKGVQTKIYTQYVEKNSGAWLFFLLICHCCTQGNFKFFRKWIPQYWVYPADELFSC